MTAQAPERIATARLHLVRWRPDDAAELRALLDANDAHLRPWIPFMQQEPRSLDATRARIVEFEQSFDAGEHVRYAIRLGSGETIGETMLLDRGGPGTREAGYWIDRRHAGQGFVTEATAALLPVAFGALGSNRVILRCDERNAPSRRVAEKLGGLRCGSETLTEPGATVVLAVYEIRAERWSADSARVRTPPGSPNSEGDPAAHARPPRPRLGS